MATRKKTVEYAAYPSKDVVRLAQCLGMINAPLMHAMLLHNTYSRQSGPQRFEPVNIARDFERFLKRELELGAWTTVLRHPTLLFCLRHHILADASI